jgi:hypothetical protein
LERKERYDNAVEFRHNKRTPTFSNFWTWKYLDAGYSLNTALRDFTIMEKCLREHHELYQFDAYIDTGFRNPLRTSDAFGARFHHVNETGDAVLADDRTIIEAEEYKEYIANPAKFYWEKGFRRYAREGLTLREFVNGVAEAMAQNDFIAKMADVFENEYGCLSGVPIGGMVSIPFETLFNFMRGMKPLGLDIRKHKAELVEMQEFLWQTQGVPALEAAAAAPPRPENCYADFNLAFLAHSILSVKQFEELYWPYVKPVIDLAVATNRRVSVFCEAEMIRFAEFFQDVPKGVLVIHPEQDDIFEFRKVFPNITVMGGMPTHLLGRGTKQECVEYAKRLINEMGEGFIFSTNKMMSFRIDAKRENLLATMDFVREYEA